MVTTMSDPLEPYRKVLGINADATLDDISTAYYHWLGKIPENPTDEEEQLHHRLKHAYSVLKRNYTPPRGVLFGVQKRTLFSLVGLALVVVAAAFLVLNWSDLKVMVTRYEPGEVLRWQNQPVPFGKVVGYEKEHQFHNGKPSPAYQILLLNEDRSVWLGERLVVMGMAPIDPKRAQTAGFSTTGE